MTKVVIRTKDRTSIQSASQYFSICRGGVRMKMRADRIVPGDMAFVEQGVPKDEVRTRPRLMDDRLTYDLEPIVSVELIDG